jgi:hypothetical protein
MPAQSFKVNIFRLSYTIQQTKITPARQIYQVQGGIHHLLPDHVALGQVCLVDKFIEYSSLAKNLVHNALSNFHCT